MYSYITCRPDISYAVTTLSKFSAAPTTYHYKLLKGVAKYLRNTIDWGIRFKCPKQLHHPDFQESRWYNTPNDPSVSFDVNIDSPQLVSFVDAADANELRKRRSTTGYVFTFCGGAIVYKSKTQSLMAGSSTETEFIAAHLAAKAERYLCFLLFELGYEQSEPTPIYIHNMSALQIINDNTLPTECTRHMDIRCSAI